MNSFSQKYSPLIYVSGFNFLTIFLFYSSPIEWNTSNLFIFGFFSLISQLAIIVGFRSGYKSSKNNKTSTLIFSKVTNNHVNFMFIFYGFTFLIKYAYLLKFEPYEVKEMFSFLLIGVIDPQLGYKLSLDTSRAYTLPWTLYFIISIVNQLFFVFCFLKWKSFTNFKKSIFLFFLCLEIFFWAGRGTNFGVISIVTTYLLSTLFQKRVIAIYKNSLNAIRQGIIVVSLAIASITFFTNNLTKRAGDNDLNFQDLNFGGSVVNESAVALQLIPNSLQQSYMYVISYLTQGYYHTCLAFDLEFKPTYFLANNPSLINFVDIFGINYFEDTYVYRLRDKGVDPEINWHSAYTWYASDISYFGVPILFMFFGYVFGYSWNLGYTKDDFLSKMIVIVFGNMLFFIFANNNYLSSIFYSFIFLFPIWSFTRLNKSRNN